MKGWYGTDSIPAKIYAVVKVSNLSDKTVVLPGFARWAPGFVFTCDSPAARLPPWFITLSGEIEWIFLAPGESVYGIENIAQRIAFLQTGRYHIGYQVAVGYAYVTGAAPPSPQIQDRYQRDHTAVARGSLEVLVSTNEVYSSAWLSHQATAVGP